MAYNHIDMRALFPLLREGDIAGGVQVRLQHECSPGFMVRGVAAGEELAVHPPALAALGTRLGGIGGIDPLETDVLQKGLELYGPLYLRKRPMRLPEG